METYHAQKGRGFYLDRQGAPRRRNRVLRAGKSESISKTRALIKIAPRQVLNRLRTARRTFEPPIYPRLVSTSRQPSIYERELERPRLNPDPLPQPCPHVFDSTPMRPVSHAIQEGVGLLLGSATSAVTGRGSMFGKFW
jgi:hypothetical protein